MWDKLSHEGKEFEFSFTDNQKDLIADYFMIYGKSKNSEAYILGTDLQSNTAFREVNYPPTQSQEVVQVPS